MRYLIYIEKFTLEQTFRLCSKIESLTNEVIAVKEDTQVLKKKSRNKELKREAIELPNTNVQDYLLNNANLD